MDGEEGDEEGKGTLILYSRKEDRTKKEGEISIYQMGCTCVGGARDAASEGKGRNRGSYRRVEGKEEGSCMCGRGWSGGRVIPTRKAKKQENPIERERENARYSPTKKQIANLCSTTQFFFLLSRAFFLSLSLAPCRRPLSSLLLLLFL